MDNIHVKLYEIWTNGKEMLFKESLRTMHDGWTDELWTKTNHNSSPGELNVG